MKQKLSIKLALALCVLICAISFAGCSHISGAEEFQAFKQKVVTVLNDNGIDVFENQGDEVDGAVVSPTAKYVSTNSVNQMKDIILGDSDVLSDIAIVEQVRQDMYEQALIIPLIVGDGLVSNHNVDTIYNTQVMIDSWWKSYIELKTAGSITTINSYTPASNGDVDYVGVVYLDYTSKDNYNFVMLLAWSDGRMGYRYGNAQKQFVYLDYDPQDEYSQVFCSPSAGLGYISPTPQIVSQCFELVKSQFSGMKVEDYNYLTEPKCTIDGEEWVSLCAKYFPIEA